MESAYPRIRRKTVMSYFEDRLAPGESILISTRLHWLSIVQHGLLALTVGIAVEIVLFLLLIIAQFLRFMLSPLHATNSPDFDANLLYLVGIVPISICGLILGLINYRASQVVLTNQRIFVKTGIFRRRLFELSLNLPHRFTLRTPPLGRALGFKLLQFPRASGSKQRFARFTFVDHQNEIETWIAKRAPTYHPDQQPKPGASARRPLLIVEEVEFPDEYTARLLREASQHIEHNNPTAARRIVERLLQSDPDNANVWYMAGYLSSSPEKKRLAYERALEINPRHKHARQKLDALP